LKLQHIIEQKKNIRIKRKGITIAESPKEVAENSELLIIVVKDADAVKQVSFENNGIIKGNHEKLIVADMSTIDPSESKNISNSLWILE
jgi:3-hydroxyisobutyrate dehydrogenase and related beta-hydroxyacid dehydrogenases